MYRPTVLTSSLAVIENNFHIVRELCGGDCRQIAVIKADAYGHGLIPVAGRLEKAGAWGLAVATADEAVTLRDAGVKTAVVVLGGSPREALAEAVEKDISLTLYDCDTLFALRDEARKRGKAAKAHLKIDTGMSRIGVRGTQDLARLMAEWQACPEVKMEGLFSHLAAADTDADFTAKQKARFDRACAIARVHGFAPIRHLAASSGIALGSAFHYDAVRPGIVLYGAEVNDRFPGIRPAQRLTTRPVRVETIECGDAVGYGCTFRAQRETRVMTLPVGYGDGYPRILGGRASVLIEGCRAPVIGRVCMDQLMVDVTDIRAAGMGSEAVLLGEQGKDRITPDELARLAGTIPYEIMLGFSSRVERKVEENLI